MGNKKIMKHETVWNTGRVLTEEQLRIEELEKRVAQLEENLKTIAYALGYRPEKKDEFANRYAIPADKLNCVGILEIGESNEERETMSNGILINTSSLEKLEKCRCGGNVRLEIIQIVDGFYTVSAGCNKCDSAIKVTDNDLNNAITTAIHEWNDWRGK